MNIFVCLCSLNVIFVDGTDVPSEDTIMIRCGSEIIPGPVSDGTDTSHRFSVHYFLNYISKKIASDYKSIDFFLIFEGYLSYRFKVMPMNESSKKVLQVTLEILRDQLAEAHEVCVIESGGYHTQRFFR
ncbi:hypothetical protein HanPI659440_Chr06g0224861 [Helianthus annuus]|nr:hypothetical protein HanPI659440_Chr06g0224861 [Helianthus annuus]